MPVFMLDERILFPPVDLAIEGGILAVGGDLSPERLLLAYREGVFPWYSDGEPIIWWSPDPRFVLFPDELKISRSMRKIIDRGVFEITFDRAFRDVIRYCGETKRPGQPGTWITDEMREAYTELHSLGYAHSAEAWRDGSLAGGLYGVSLGRCFFGESMFARESNASKAALITLVRALKERGFPLIDSQVYTPHMESLGAREIPRGEYLELLKRALDAETLKGDWGEALGA
jgi:leucyl/phenylalanyl-tRNA--protein transferase